MPPFRTQSTLWYNNGIWGQLGYAVPNFDSHPTTLNATINKLVSVIGRNLAAVMMHDDSDQRTPPSINTLTRIHKLYVRARGILAGRAVPSGTPNLESAHAAPGELEFTIFPCPYFRVRNEWLREYAGLIFSSLSEAMQHSENRQPTEISANFAGLIGQYLQRVYRLMGTELFGVSAADAAKPDFTLTDAQLAAYNPSQWFTSTEMIDTVPPLHLIPTASDLIILTNGIPAGRLVNLCLWPNGEPYPMPPVPNEGNGTGEIQSSSSATSSAAATANTSMPAAPSP